MMEDKKIPKGNFDLFRKAALEKEITPSEGAWDQLSHRLDAANQERVDAASQEAAPVAKVRKLGWQQWLGIAAGLLVLIAVFTTTLKMLDDDNPAFSQLASADSNLMIEDLAINKDQSNNFYALAVKCNQYYNTSPSRMAEGKFDQRIQVTEGKNRRRNDAYIENDASSIAANTASSATTMSNKAMTQPLSSVASNYERSEAQSEITVSGEANSDVAPVTNSVAMEKAAEDKIQEFADLAENDVNVPSEITSTFKPEAKDANSIALADGIAADQVHSPVPMVSVRAKTSSTLNKEAEPSASCSILLGKWKTAMDGDLVLMQEWIKTSDNTYQGSYYSIQSGKKKELSKVTLLVTGDLLSILNENEQVISSNLKDGKYQNLDEFLGVQFKNDHFIQLRKNGIFKHSKKGRTFTKVD